MKRFAIYPRWPWVKASDEARRRGVKKRGFERWLHGLNATVSGTLLGKFGPARNAHLWVNVRALQRMAGPTARQREQEEQELRGRVEECEGEIKSIRRHLRLAKRAG